MRPAPEGWITAKSVHEAKIHYIQHEKDKTMVISLDHDAGDYYYMGGDYIEFLKWLERKQYEEGWEINASFHLHSQNPVGVQNMRAIIQRNGWEEIVC